MKKYKTYLTYDELLLIDGKCSEETQEIVDKAKEEYSYGLDSICNEILAQSMKTGMLTWTSIEISKCTTCATKPFGYYTYPRSNRYHKKGDKDFSRPFRYRGIQPNSGFILLEGVSGICRDCWFNIYLPKLVNHIIKNKLPIEIQKNDIAETLYMRDKIRVCKDCGYEMRESEMGRKLCYFGGGTYPATCPKCHSENNNTTNKFVMTEITKKEN